RGMTVMEGITSERIRLSIEGRQPGPGDMGDPEHAGMVLIERQLIVVNQGDVEGDLACIPIERIQSSAGAHPKRPRPVLGGLFYLVAAQAKGFLRIVAIADDP